MDKTWVQVLAWEMPAEGLALLTQGVLLEREDVSPGQRPKLATLLISSPSGLLAVLMLLPCLLGTAQTVVKQDPGHADLAALLPRLQRGILPLFRRCRAFLR